mgnify:CR=1 FL=1
MFSVNNFYDYLSANYNWPRKNSAVYSFKTHGGRDVNDLIYWNDVPTIGDLNDIERLFYLGKIATLDQEPILFDQLHYINRSEKENLYSDYYSVQKRLEFLLSSVHTSFVCHSEVNSQEVNYLTEAGLIDIHYWYHGLIARDWYRHWKHYKVLHNSSHRLGCYIRDTSGTRQYRIELLEFIKNNNIYCPLINGQQYNSDASAMLEWNDTEKFDIHVVAETLFDTQKTHLTEKVLKPVAMEQPFILFAGPNSLKYMRNYGFQTFSSCWDESYDEIEDSHERYLAITKLLNHLNTLPDDQYKRISERARLIAKNNRDDFLSQFFEDMLLKEVHNGLENALLQQEELFFTKPGGTWFPAAKEFMAIPGIYDIRPRNLAILNHINLSHPAVAKQIFKQYPACF